jgi:hypothetical protein
MRSTIAQCNRCQDSPMWWFSRSESQTAVDYPWVDAYSHTPTWNTECGHV